MAEQKIFIGPRIRRVRNGLELTQTAMAEGLGISPSYLNLIERNQRPLTVQLLLKLASVYKVDIEELRGQETGSATTELRAIFSDQLLVGELPGDQELIELADAAPNVAAGFIKLYRAYREQAGRLSDLADLLAREGHETTLSEATLPIDIVRDTLEQMPCYFAGIENAVETFHEALKPGEDLWPSLKAWLRDEHGIAVRTLPLHTMPNLRRRYDRHSLRLFLSERLSPADQLREVAIEVCQLALREALVKELDHFQFSGAEAKRIARFELARYAAHALIMPYNQFHSAAERCRYDMDVLRARFSTSFEQVANRLCTLQRPNNKGLPFFFLEIDQAGNPVRRAGSTGFPKAKFGGDCPKLAIHAAFSQPGQISVDRVVLPDGAEYLTVARTLEGPQAVFNERVRRTAILVGCALPAAAKTVYVDALSTDSSIEVGTACRLCERQGCLARAKPPITRPLGLDEMAFGLSVFDFQ